MPPLALPEPDGDATTAELARRRALPRAGAGGQAELRADGRERGRGGGDLPPARRPPARDRARGGAGQAALARSRSSAASEKRLDLLTGGARPAGAAATRSATRSTGATTCSSRPSKPLFARLGVFVGGARSRPPRPSAATQAEPRRGARRPRLARRQQPRPPGGGRRRRASVRMLETIREYALERLEERRASSRSCAGGTPTATSSSPRPPSPSSRARPGALARAARRGERQHPRRARVVVRVRPGRARPAARRRARPLLEHPRADERGPPLARRGARGLARASRRPLAKAYFAAGFAALGQGDFRRRKAGVRAQPRARPRGRRRTPKRPRCSRSAGS